MAIRFDASGDSLSRTRLAGAKTVTAWVYIATDRNDYSVFFGLGSNELIGTGSDGTTLLHYDGVTERTGSALSTGTWYHLAYTSNGDDIGNGFTVYLNGASSITSSGRAQASAGTNMYLGNDQYSEWLNGRLAHVKVWSAALTAAEILQEMHSIRPQRLANLHSWLPMIATGSDRTNEAGGAGNTWTANGTLTDEAGPPVSWGVAPWVVPFVAAGAGALTGAGAATLAGITSDAAGVIPLTGAGAATLAGITSAAAGTIASTGASEGAGAATLAGITSAAAGTIAITATAAVTLAGITSDAAGVIPLTGAGAATLAGIDTPQTHALRFYGNATGQIDRARIELDSPADPPIDVGAGDFAYEFWMRCALADNATTATDEDARYSNIILDRDIWSHARGWVLGVTRNAGNSALVVCFGVAGAGLSWVTIFGASNVGDGDWHHIALTRATSTVRLFVDGVQDATGTYSGDLSYPDGVRPTEGQDNQYLVIGTEKHDVGFGYDGEISQLRVSDAARYTASFTPPRQFTPDADTVALFLFIEGSGASLRDTAGLSGAEAMELLIGGTPSGPTWLRLPNAEIAALTTLTGTGAATLAGVASTGAGIIPLTATATVTLAGITSAAAAIIPLTANAAATLAGITGAAAGVIGSIPLTGAGAAPLAGITSDAAGTIAITATATVTLAGIASAAAGIIPLTATATVTLAGIASAAAGIIPLTATATVTLAGIASTGAAIVPIVGVGAVTLAGITGEGAGSLLSPLAGAGAVTLAGITGEGAGIILSPLTGVGAITLAGITGESTGATLTAALIFVIGAVTGGGTRSRATGGGTRSGATGGGTTARVRAIK